MEFSFGWYFLFGVGCGWLIFWSVYCCVVGWCCLDVCCCGGVVVDFEVVFDSEWDWECFVWYLEVEVGVVLCCVVCFVNDEMICGDWFGFGCVIGFWNVDLIVWFGCWWCVEVGSWLLVLLVGWSVCDWNEVDLVVGNCDFVVFVFW